jgi:hypothetical protein
MKQFHLERLMQIKRRLVPRGRIELPTSSLPMMRSTTELPRRSDSDMTRSKAPRYSLHVGY